SVQTIDNELAPQLAIRRKHREGVGPAFFDASLYTQGHVGVLPEALRPKPGRLSHSQDFVRLPWQNQSNQNVNAVPLSSPAPPGTHSLDPEDMEPNSVKLLSASSVHSAMAGGIGSHNFENEVVLSSFSSVSAPELQIPESSNELGVYGQPLPSSAASDRIANTTAEPSLTTGDALEKYRVISEEVQTVPTSLLSFHYC
ncbi:CCR4-NOT transcription complex subunit 1 isoform X1, partial [Tanacetum coccineum]